MNKPFVMLRPEITRTHALILMDWLEDERVTRFLSDKSGVSHFIEQAINRTQMPILTHLFNQGGRFFMVHNRDDVPVGFVRLVKSGMDCEIVLAIGDHDNWGRRLGGSAIVQSLKLAFFDMRARRVIAKIHPDNARSLRAFKRCGFLAADESSTSFSLSMDVGRYLQLLRAGAMSEDAGLFITTADKSRLEDLIAADRAPKVFELEHEIERASIVDPKRIAADVVTMNSKVVLQLAGECKELTLVYPQQADEQFGKQSVLSDVGAAILGYREGDVVDWMVSDRPQEVTIQTLIYQPEASGDFHL
ncbi:bifunctional GNAT family N-acetyltransferase/nucleoside diphosphate kinase regulator [Pelagibacterium lentulum]|uniref:GNAT family acetyltransferase n=1 Tax=Pelagibacterium lentulum TaxID=2029865 RepID=A0A916R992_9HYPH|nr:GNAT family N-acetyltransferase [Pelagibacterium lentulum]GGA42952.1 GNAT family acetyltransferase [Pelagibacterium lentulum]